MAKAIPDFELLTSGGGPYANVSRPRISDGVFKCNVSDDDDVKSGDLVKVRVSKGSQKQTLVAGAVELVVDSGVGSPHVTVSLDGEFPDWVWNS